MVYYKRRVILISHLIPLIFHANSRQGYKFHELGIEMIIKNIIIRALAVAVTLIKTTNISREIIVI